MTLAAMLDIPPAEIDAALSRLAGDPRKLARLHDLTRHVDTLIARDRFEHLFPDAAHEWRGETYHAREGYRAHLEFFRATRDYQEVCFRAANRVGKSVANAYAIACFATGRYPAWWEGRRFPGPVNVWIAGKTNETTRDILQGVLFGPVIGSGPSKRLAGTGVIPGSTVGKPSWKAGVSDLVDTVPVRHVSGRMSEIGLKAYEQGRGAFEGTAKDVIAFDEEPPQDVYSEALIRLMTRRGLMLLSYTPMEGLSDVTRQFEEQEETD